MVNVYAYEKPQEIAAGLGKYILKQQKYAIQEDEQFTVAVLGGSLPKMLKRALVDNKEVADHIEWLHWVIYFVDERLVPLNHADSNYLELNKELLRHLKNPPKVVPIEALKITGNDGQVEGADLAKDKEVAKDYAAVLPDLINLGLLGVGPDGHTCSLFPGSDTLKVKDEDVVAIHDSPKPPPRRITFTLPMLRKVELLAFVAEGEGKKEALAEIFNNPRSGLPAQVVNNNHEDVSWFVDNKALQDTNVHTSKY